VHRKSLKKSEVVGKNLPCKTHCKETAITGSIKQIHKLYQITINCTNEKTKINCTYIRREVNNNS
jgi:hypothetical protein